MIMLTGATGFLGSRLLRKLLGEQYEVVCLKRKSSDMKRVEGVQEECEWFDIEDGCFESVFQTYPIDGVIHCATDYGRGEAAAALRKTVFGVYDSNFCFPFRLLECADKYACKLFINTSTFMVKAIKDVQMQQEKLYMDLYVKSKYMFSKVAKDNIEQLKIGFVDLQLEHVYGKDGRKSKFVDWLLSELCSDREGLALTEGKQVRDWIYIDDVIDSYMTVLNNRDFFQGGNYYHYEVGTGRGTSLCEFVTLAHELTKSNVTLEFGAKEMAPNELMVSCADNKALCELGWHPQIDIAQGIQKILEEG